MNRTTIQARPPSPSRGRYRLTRRGKVVFTLLPLLALAGVVAGVAGFTSQTPLTVEAPEDGALLGAAGVDGGLEVRVETAAPSDAVEVRLDGEAVPVTAADDGAAADLGVPADGEHTLEVVVDPGLFDATARETRTFTVDTTPPGVEVTEPSGPVPPTEQMTLRLSVDDPAAEVAVGGQQVTLDESGAAAVTYPEPPDGSIEVTATDPAGNATTETVPVVLALPGAPGGPPIRGCTPPATRGTPTCSGSRSWT